MQRKRMETSAWSSKDTCGAQRKEKTKHTGGERRGFGHYRSVFHTDVNICSLLERLESVVTESALKKKRGSALNSRLCGNCRFKSGSNGGMHNCFPGSDWYTLMRVLIHSIKPKTNRGVIPRFS